MNIAPIKTTRDYDRTLRRIEQLMNATPGTRNGDELDVLTTLVEAYEALCQLPSEAGRSHQIQDGSTWHDTQRSGSDARWAGTGFGNSHQEARLIS